jgi:hypothetical protein
VPALIDLPIPRLVCLSTIRGLAHLPIPCLDRLSIRGLFYVPLRGRVDLCLAYRVLNLNLNLNPKPKPET